MAYRPGIVVLCGRSFSGKSTVAAALAAELPAVPLSFDAINAERGLVSGDGVPVQEWGRTYAQAQDRARRAIEAGSVVIIDDTSSPRFLRDGWRELAAGLQVPMVLVYVDTPIEVSLARHAGNRVASVRADVSDKIMSEHLDSFEPPTADEDPVRLVGGRLTPERSLAIRRRLTATGGPDRRARRAT